VASSDFTITKASDNNADTSDLYTTCGEQFELQTVVRLPEVTFTTLSFTVVSAHTKLQAQSGSTITKGTAISTASDTITIADDGLTATFDFGATTVAYDNTADEKVSFFPHRCFVFRGHCPPGPL